MKVFVSNNGIKHNVDTYFDDSVDAFYEALSIAGNIPCPTSFKYRTEVRNLYKEINKYKNKMKYVQSALDRVQKSYDNYNDSYIQKSKRLIDADIHDKPSISSINSILN